MRILKCAKTLDYVDHHIMTFFYENNQLIASMFNTLPIYEI